MFCEEMEHVLNLAGIIISRVGRPAAHREESVVALRSTFSADVLDGELTERVAVSKAAAKNVPVYEAGDADAASEFEAVSAQLVAKMDLLP